MNFSTAHSIPVVNRQLVTNRPALMPSNFEDIDRHVALALQTGSLPIIDDHRTPPPGLVIVGVDRANPEAITTSADDQCRSLLAALGRSTPGHPGHRDPTDGILQAAGPSRKVGVSHRPHTDLGRLVHYEPALSDTEVRSHRLQPQLTCSNPDSGWIMTLVDRFEMEKVEVEVQQELRRVRLVFE
ncbi:MAG: hypothetical protein RLZ37_381, partial [Actinomycetota bacterium]